MPSWGLNRSRSESASSRVAGVVKIPGESEPLKVEIAFSGSGVVLRADDLELGSWTNDDVRITRIDPFSFAFVAEGDRLVFVPDDPKSFAHHPGVVGSAKTTSGRATKIGDWLRRDAKESKEQHRPDVVSKPPRSPRVKPQVRESNPQSGPVSHDSDEEEAEKLGLWLRMIDSARENGLFGLDRVPVHEELRDQDHLHSFEHAAAPSTGLGKHICTVCGKVRFRS